MPLASSSFQSLLSPLCRKLRIIDSRVGEEDRNCQARLYSKLDGSLSWGEVGRALGEDFCHRAVALAVVAVAIGAVDAVEEGAAVVEITRREPTPELLRAEAAATAGERRGAD
jgi:hypothetical protein